MLSRDVYGDGLRIAELWTSVLGCLSSRCECKDQGDELHDVATDGVEDGGGTSTKTAARFACRGSVRMLWSTWRLSVACVSNQKCQYSMTRCLTFRVAGRRSTPSSDAGHTV